jgi:hypothetical protein
MALQRKRKKEGKKYLMGHDSFFLLAGRHIRYEVLAPRHFIKYVQCRAIKAAKNILFERKGA